MIHKQLSPKTSIAQLTDRDDAMKSLRAKESQASISIIHPQYQHTKE